MAHIEIEQSLSYLASPAALASLSADPYWPKWDSPWWHMLLLHELGEAARIPPAIVAAMIRALNAYRVKTFPIREEELPPGTDPFRHIACHCQIGSIYQILHACGVKVDEEVPWLRPRLLAYQMADGGHNCDESAYLAEGEVPSSMVATIPMFEAVLFCTDRPFTEAELKFLHRGASFLQGRRLVEGSSSAHNASEREEAKAWRRPFFPRFYFYDILRGLHALLCYEEKLKEKVPTEALREAYEALSAQAQGEKMPNAGKAYDQNTTLRFKDGAWQRKQPATLFPLLEWARTAGDPSPALDRQWRAVQELIAKNHPEIAAR